MSMVPFSRGKWRVSSDGREVTTAPVGILDPKATVCRLEASSKAQEEVKANGKVLAAAPRMLRLLEALQEVWEATGRRADEAERMEALKAEAGAVLDGLRES